MRDCALCSRTVRTINVIPSRANPKIGTPELVFGRGVAPPAGPTAVGVGGAAVALGVLVGRGVALGAVVPVAVAVAPAVRVVVAVAVAVDACAAGPSGLPTISTVTRFDRAGNAKPA